MRLEKTSRSTSNNENWNIYAVRIAFASYEGVWTYVGIGSIDGFQHCDTNVDRAVLSEVVQLGLSGFRLLTSL